MRIGIIVGEASGDLLGAALIEQFQKIYPDIIFEGVLGPRLQALGGRALYDAERLAVMGFVEPLKRLPELLRMRRHLCQYFIDNPPDVFIGIDAPDFTLAIEKKLKKHGITTVHYVSPSVWAWRQGRIKTIKQAVNLMLVLFPFEEVFYRQYGVRVAYVGHPMARQIDLATTTEANSLCKRIDVHGEEGDVSQSKEQHLARFSCDVGGAKTLAILPGSRHSEIANIAPTFLQAAMKLKEAFPDLRLVSPMASPAIREHFLKIKIEIAPNLEIELFDGQADDVLAMSDCALITSGTATLQAMLHACPMVVGFKTSLFNAWLIRRFYKHRFFALPNILCEQAVVKEYFQEAMTVENLYYGVKELLEHPAIAQGMVQKFSNMHKKLREPAADAGVRAIVSLLRI